jgi:GntR family transcriptional regulator
MTNIASISRSRVPLYLQLATLFRSKIVCGQWTVGEKIPNLDDLAIEFAVARGTIREAMGELEKEGLIARVRGKGSFIRQSPLQTPVHQLESDWTSIIAAHEGVSIRILEQTTVTTLPFYAAQDGSTQGAYRMFRRLHLRDDHPYLLGRSYLANSIYAQVPPRRFGLESILAIVHEVLGTGIGRARQVLTVDAADVEAAGYLDVPLNAPVARVRRTVSDQDGNLVYMSDGLYRGDTVRLDITLR